MLYLTRKLDESIIINDKIEVKVIDVKGKSVKLGFEFPKDASILRKEVYDNIVEENLRASKAGGESQEDFFSVNSPASDDDTSSLEADGNK